MGFICNSKMKPRNSRMFFMLYGIIFLGTFLTLSMFKHTVRENNSFDATLDLYTTTLLRANAPVGHVEYSQQKTTEVLDAQQQLWTIMGELMNIKYQLSHLVNNKPLPSYNGSQWTQIEKPQYPELPGNLSACPLIPGGLKGREKISQKYYSFATLGSHFSDTEPGGRWRPRFCKATRKVAIILPYRDRDNHLKLFLHNTIPKLQRQLVDYTLYVVEQAPNSGFNRGMMRNIGFVEAMKLGSYDCVIFNDVDTVIEDDRNLYRCPSSDKKVLHMAPDVDVFGYRLAYSYLIGGILSIYPEQFMKVNGYSNGFFVWGAEDDDLHRRLARMKIYPERPTRGIGYITTLLHERDPRTGKRMEIYNNIKDHWQEDGVNSLRYNIVAKEYRKLFTWIYVSVDENDMSEIVAKFKNQTKPASKV